jgi:hypothetical protein
MADFARALQGFGAGVAGQGGQFIQGLRDEQAQLDEQRSNALLKDAFTARQHLLGGDSGSALTLFDNRLRDIGTLGGDPSDTQGVRDMVASGDISGAIRELSIPIDFAIAQGQLIAPGGQADKPAEQLAFEAVIADFSPEDKVIANRIKAGLEGRAVGSSVQTIAEKGTAAVIAETEGIIAGGKEGGKLTSQLKFKPQIQKAVTLATKEATARGESLTSLGRAEAAMPGLLDSIGQLKTLASVATSTLGGRAFDALVKETGFGSTKGADSRVKFISIINNQVLPLLRETFGAAFTEREGETLKATMGDPNATPSQKILQLESFIDQKTRSIEGLQRELGKDVGVSLEGLSDEQLQTMLGQAQ